jgi:hypothetical protein
MCFCKAAGGCLTGGITGAVIGAGVGIFTSCISGGASAAIGGQQIVYVANFASKKTPLR